MDSNQTVWSARLDGIYDCAVHRDSPSLGTLTVKRTSGELLGSGRVTFSYDAAFGPDADDVADWQDWTIDFVNGMPNPENPLRPSKENPA